MNFKGSTQKIDLIGDIHGHYLELRLMLEKFGYSFQGLNLAHPENRKLAFVGDFINRGPQSVEVLKLVKSLQESGKAFVVLGNHEFKLVQNLVAGNSIPDEFIPFIAWLRTLPLFLELETLRIVHAAWHFSSIKILEQALVADDLFIKETFEKESMYKRASQSILSGIKTTIPKDLKLVDRFAIPRAKGRLKWWLDLRGKPYSECFFSPMFPKISDRGPIETEVSMLEPYTQQEKPVFIGHYCLPPNIPKIFGQVVCLDGCVTCDKRLWGYRYEGEHIPETSNLIQVKLEEI